VGAARAVPATRIVERRDEVCMLAVLGGLIIGGLVDWLVRVGWMS
jgi:hypothetical protein